MQLKALTDRVQFIAGQMVNVGLILLNDDRVVLIDSGFDRRSTKKILDLLTDYRYKVAAILNTHAHADHMGGNKFLVEACGCKVYASPMEAPAVQNPLMQAIALFGGNPIEEMKNHFIVAEASPVEVLPEGFLDLEGVRIEILDLPGHSIGQKGFLVDGVAFVGDALFSSEHLAKNRLIYMYSPLEQLETLKRLRDLKASWYVGGHFPPGKTIENLVADNRQHVETVFKYVRGLLSVPQPLDKLVKDFLGNFHVRKTGWEHFLYRSTVQGYLTALKQLGEADLKVMDNLLIWFSTGQAAV